MGTRFGDYLKHARLSAGFKTQQAAADTITKLGRKISQGLINQYENGKIADPDPSTLRLIAEAYNLDYMAVVLQLIRDKYDPDSEWTKPGLAAERLNLWEAGLKRFPKVGEVKGLEEDQLRAKAAFVASYEVLDFQGGIKWQSQFSNLQELWVVVPDFLDDTNPEVQAATIKHLKKGVRICYFVPEGEEQTGGRFWLLQRTLSLVNPKVTQEMIEDQVVGFTLDKKQQRWVNTNLIIANPLQFNEATGYRIIRQASGPVFFIRLTNSELQDLVTVMRSWVIEQLEIKNKPPFYPPLQLVTQPTIKQQSKAK